MRLENLTLDILKQEFAKVKTNGTFKMWAIPYIAKTYNIDAATALCVFEAITFDHRNF